MANRDHFRSIARRPVSLRAHVTSDTGAAGIAASVVNLGLGGACLETHEAFAEGQRVCIQLFAPNLWDPLLLDAQVAWQQPTGAANRVGLRFEHYSGSMLLALVDLIASNAYQAE
jgi:Tfp pilus assembly protein PilZ